MKTPMQELIEKIEYWTTLDDPLRCEILADIQIWLEKERQELKDAFEMGVSAWASGCAFEYYYNETYEDTEQ
jgi:hypothetical protein